MHTETARKYACKNIWRPKRVSSCFVPRIMRRARPPVSWSVYAFISRWYSYGTISKVKRSIAATRVLSLAVVSRDSRAVLTAWIAKSHLTRDFQSILASLWEFPKAANAAALSEWYKARLTCYFLARRFDGYSYWLLTSVSELTITWLEKKEACATENVV